MAVVQSIQSGQFALESRMLAVDDETCAAAALAIADIAGRRGLADHVSAVREVLEALGLASAP